MAISRNFQGIYRQKACTFSSEIFMGFTAMFSTAEIRGPQRRFCLFAEEMMAISCKKWFLTAGSLQYTQLFCRIFMFSMEILRSTATLLPFRRRIWWRFHVISKVFDSRKLPVHGNVFRRIFLVIAAMFSTEIMRSSAKFLPEYDGNFTYFHSRRLAIHF